MKKTIKLGLAAIAMSLCGAANAQQLPNIGFDNWKGENNAGSSYQTSSGASGGGTTALGLRQRPGDEPSEWNGSSVNQKVIITGSKVLITKQVSGNNTYAELANAFVGVGNLGSNAPAYLTFGTPWVYAISTVSKCDGGTYGGYNFTYKPDAVKCKFKKTMASTAENSYLIAYIWNGTFNSNVTSGGTVALDDVEHAILGSQSETGISSPSTVNKKGNLIAYFNTSFAEKASSDWETIEVPFKYIDANKGLTPSKINVIISAGDYWNRSNIQAGTTLDLDDVDVVYWNTLKTLSYDGTNLLTGETTDYAVNGVYDQSKLEYAPKSDFATASKSYDASTGKLTITVTRENADSKVYTIQFDTKKTYTENLYVNVDGDTTGPQDANVDVITQNSGENKGKINFTLKNFILGSGDDAMPVGNIAIENLSVSQEGEFSYKGDIEIAEGDDPSVEGWLGPLLGEIPLDLTGKFVGDNLVLVTINISLSGQVINVHLGYDRATMAVNSAAKYGTFCAPFDVTIPDGVTASTAKLNSNGRTLDLTNLTTTIPACTPVILQSDAEVSTEFYGVSSATETSNTNGCLTGVYADTPITSGYVLQNLSETGVGFYKVSTNMTVPANRAYIKETATQEAKALYFSDTTAIQAIKALTSGDATEIYSANGTRQNKLQKGLNIMKMSDGKSVKVMVK